MSSAMSSAMSSEWTEVEAAKDRGGLRLVVTDGVPGPWGEAAKGVFRIKGVPFVKVRQRAGQANDALVAWTGQRNAPIAVYEDEPPRTGWLEILLLAERLAPEPSLVPADPRERAFHFGLCHELMSEGGFGWCRRLMLFARSAGDDGRPQEAVRPVLDRMFRQYGYRPEAARRAPTRVAEVLQLLSEQLARQRAQGNAYLMGPRLTAVDVYWAAMAGLVSPLPPEQCAMSAGMRAVYEDVPPELSDALDPALLAHRDHVYEKYLGLPVDL